MCGAMFTEAIGMVGLGELAKIEGLEARIKQLEDQVEMYRQEVGVDNEAPLHFNFTPNEGKIFSILMKREFAYNSLLMTFLYSDRLGKEEPESRIIKVWISRMRDKLSKFDIGIKTLWGRGYYIIEEDKIKAREIYKSCKKVLS